MAAVHHRLPRSHAFSLLVLRDRHTPGSGLLIGIGPALVSEGTALGHELNVLSEAVEEASPLAPSPRALGPPGAVEQALLPHLEGDQVLHQTIVIGPALRPRTFTGAGEEVGGALRWPVRPEMG